MKILAAKAKKPKDLLNISGIKIALLNAAGVSDKAANYMEDKNKIEAIRGLIENFLEPAGPDFVEELVFRFLLTQGDALGGTMRNLAGVLAQRKLSRAIIAGLRNAGMTFKCLTDNSGLWNLEPQQDDKIKGISWSSNNKKRTLLYNKKVPIVGNNVDVAIINIGWESLDNEIKIQDAIRNPALYIALGELKGGIDPAGADERWKTASTAISRIRSNFAKISLSPKIFFIAASISRKMAREIWKQLDQHTLHNAANLTDQTQIASICNWVITI